MLPAREIEDLLCRVIESKIKSLKRTEVAYKPFYTPLLGTGTLLTHQIVQSILTTFGMSVFEKVACLIARDNFDEVVSQFKLNKALSKRASDVITKMIDDLRNKSVAPNAAKEYKALRYSTVSISDSIERDTVKVDLFLRRNRDLFLIDLKTVKPNKRGILDYKRQILEWAAQGFVQFGTKYNILSAVAMPYNPYHPEPYLRFDIDKIFDVDGGQLLVGEEFWNFVAGDDVFDELLAIFERAGSRVRPKLEELFIH